jgi:hypothetical protein
LGIWLQKQKPLLMNDKGPRKRRKSWDHKSFVGISAISVSLSTSSLLSAPSHHSHPARTSIERLFGKCQQISWLHYTISLVPYSIDLIFSVL